MIVLEELRSISRQFVGNATTRFRETVAEILGTLCGKLFTENVTGFSTIVRIEITVGIHPAHVVHRGGHGRLDTRVGCCGIDGQSAPAADTDNADPFGIYFVVGGKEIDGCRKILGIDVGRYHVTGFAATLSGVGGVKSDSQKTSLGHCLCIKSGGLLLDSSERPADGDGG